MKTWAIGLMSNDEKRNILDKHKHLYDGYRTMQPEIKKEQPLYVQDFANDKGGVTLNNRNTVTSYKNFGINEQVEQMEDECMECGNGEYMEESKGMCSECGVMSEGECMECGWKGEMEEETQQVEDLDNFEDLNPKNKFDYVEGEVEEYGDQGSAYKNMDSSYDFDSEGPDVSGDVYTVKADDMDLDDEEVKPAFDFDSEGPMKVYETMISAFSDQNGFGKDSFMNSMSQKFEEDMEDEDMEDEEELYPTFSDDNFIGMSKKSGDMEDGEFLYDVDEDLKESVIIQKNRIMEMMNRMKRF
jgi:hypothetical protein